MITARKHSVFAIRYGRRIGARRREFVVGGDPARDDEVLDTDYFVWLIRSDDADVVVDVGFTAATNARRTRDHWEDPAAALRRLGVQPERVPTVILSHLHYDHAGDLAPFSRATVVLQRSELAFWSGPGIQRPDLAKHVEQHDLDTIGRIGAEGRLRLVHGDAEVMSGIRVRRVGGHTPGSQIVAVDTAAGVVVLAADASPLFENVEQGLSFPVRTDADETVSAFDSIASSSDPGLVVPGHDHLLFERFTPVDGLEERAVRIA